MIDWPESLLTEVAERRCAIVVGAGVSASATNEAGERPPSWNQFLTSALSRIADIRSKDAANELIQGGKYLDAAQIVYDSLDRADYTTLIRNTFELRGYRRSAIHEALLEIDPKIFITTNYDRLLETSTNDGSISEGYNVCRQNDTHIMNDLRSDRRMILKAHGCVSDPQNAVLTRSQYYKARRDFASFYAVLDSIFLTNTLLFVGSGFNGDPDIDLMLQNANISAPSDHPHYAVIDDSKHPSVMRALSETYNVKFLTYPSGKYEEISLSLKDLAGRVASVRSIPT